MNSYFPILNVFSAGNDTVFLHVIRVRVAKDGVIHSKNIDPTISGVSKLQCVRMSHNMGYNTTIIIHDINNIDKIMTENRFGPNTKDYVDTIKWNMKISQ